MGESERVITLPGEFLFVYNGQEGDWGRQEERLSVHSKQVLVGVDKP